MSTRDTQMTVHPALGGLDISTDPTVLDPSFLTIADNIEYLEGGQRKKRLGTTIYSTSTTNTPTYLVSSSSNVRAVEDFWRYGSSPNATTSAFVSGTLPASLTPTQNLINVTSASIFTSTGDGMWTAATAASSFGANSNIKTMITLAGDYAVLSDETATPIAWSTSAGLTNPSTGASATFPKFTGSVYHLNRLFTWGYSTQPSLVAFTAAGNIFDSTGGDSGNFLVNLGDGDQVNAISDPFFSSIYVFKGPQKGSIWQLSGTTPTTFSMVQIGYGAPVMNPRSVITTPTDVYWLSQYGVHSLETTVKFGNVEQAFLSLPIQKLWRNNLIQRSMLKQAFAVWHPTRNMVGWCVTPAGDTTSRWFLMYNYALSDSKPGGKKYWSIWKFPGFGLKSANTMLTPATWDALLGAPRGTGTPVMMLGTDQGFMLAGDNPNLDDFGSAYTAEVRTPTITRFQVGKNIIPETQEKGFVGIVTYINPKGAYNANLTMTVDRRNQSTTISLAGGGATLT